MQTEESKNQKLFVNKPLAKGYNVVEKPDYDNSKKRKDDYYVIFSDEINKRNLFKPII